MASGAQILQILWEAWILRKMQVSCNSGRNRICRISAYSLASRAPSHCRLPMWTIRCPCWAWYCWIRAITRVPAGTEVRRQPHCSFLPICRKRCVRNRRKLGDRRNRRSRAWYSSIFRCNSITNCLSRPRRMRRVRLKATAISLENITFWMRKKRFPAVIWGRVSAARMPTAVNSRYWNSMTILRFPRGMITATHSLEQCRFREKWPRLMRRRRLRQARLAV